MKKVFNILLYLSFIFVIIYLFNFDYIEIDWSSINYYFLALSTILLWAGLTFSTISWWNALRVHSIKIKVPVAIISHGLAVFTKYIPGKIWTILSRASYVSTGANQSMKTVSFISLKEQLIYVWVGLAVGSIPMLFIYGFSEFSIVVLAIFLALSFFIFSTWFHNLVIRIIRSIIKKELEIPLVGFNEVSSIIIYCLGYWIIWMFAFYMFCISFYPESSFSVAFAFPLSVTLGLLAIIVPGGIGVREGIITAYLVQTGIPLKEAGMISVIARLWFITGEIFIFGLAILLKYRRSE